MVSTRKIRQSNRMLLSQLDEFDQKIIGSTVSDRQENAMVNEGTGDQDITGGAFDNNLMTNETTVNGENLGKIFY